jgi:MinD-like ATPase involved in chromosome partitioning or flagellar assembly
MIFKKRINIFTGNFGSGKTEVAINSALEISKMGYKTAIADMDIVNPYFRTADARQRLEGSGIKVITPVFANTNADVPALPAEISTLFENREYRTVLDVGGDDLGAKALSRYKREIESNEWDMFFVVNTRRPMTDTVEKIEEMIDSIEQSSRLSVTGLVNNTNLLSDTSPKDLIEGYEILQKVAEKKGIPIVFTSALKEVVIALAGKINTEFLILDKIIRLPWE